MKKGHLINNMLFMNFSLKHHTISIITTINILETHKKLFQKFITFLEQLYSKKIH